MDDRFSGLGELVVRTQKELDDEPKHVPGIPNLRIHGSQSLESKALRRHLGLEELEVTGGVRGHWARTRRAWQWRRWQRGGGECVGSGGGNEGVVARRRRRACWHLWRQ